LDYAAAEAQDAFHSDLRLAQDAARAAVSSKRAAGQDKTWELWCDYCAELNMDPLLEGAPDPIPYLMVFGERVRDGRLAKSGQPVRHRTVEDALRAVGQTMASMGSTDKRLIAPKQLDYRLAQQIVGYGRTDPAPNRVKPVPLSLIGQMQRIAQATNNAFEHANADMAIIGFFFLCRPGEYVKATDADSKSAPFRLCDVEFHIGGRLLEAATAPVDLIERATFVHLVYTDQKNGVRGEKIGHGANPANPEYGCPVRALAR
jgi:hypothetical protein